MISGFTFVRDAIRFDFPLQESLQSLMSLCDEVVVAVGESSDETLDLVHALDDGRLKIVRTIWDDALREGGRVLAQQTDVALSHCRGDWCIYLQADEVFHEDDESTIRRAIAEADGDRDVEALLFRYLHFYGNFDYVGTGRQWYRQEIRAVRNGIGAFSWGDAQGFRRRDERGEPAKLRARRIDARVFHYGWVKDPRVQLAKQRHASRFWHEDDWIDRNIPDTEMFDYGSAFELERYTGNHPAVMRGRIERSRSWAARFDPSRLRHRPLGTRFLDALERATGKRIGEYRNFREERGRGGR